MKKHSYMVKYVTRLLTLLCKHLDTYGFVFEYQLCSLNSELVDKNLYLLMRYINFPPTEYDFKSPTLAYTIALDIYCPHNNERCTVVVFSYDGVKPIAIGVLDKTYYLVEATSIPQDIPEDIEESLNFRLNLLSPVVCNFLRMRCTL